MKRFLSLLTGAAMFSLPVIAFAQSAMPDYNAGSKDIDLATIALTMSVIALVLAVIALLRSHKH